MRSTLLLASLLAILPFSSASPTRFPSARQVTATVEFVNSIAVSDGTYDLQGPKCLTDSETNRVLPNSVTPSGPFTVRSCVLACQANHFTMVGVENGQSCFCSNDQTVGNLPDQGLTNCEEPCLGDDTEACGGFNFFLLYKFG